MKVATQKETIPVPLSGWRNATASVHLEVAGHLDDHEMHSALQSSSITKSLVDRSLPDLDQPVDRFRTAYWKAECLSKFPFRISGIDRAAIAMEAFTAAETRCEQANLSLGFFPNPYCSTSKVVRRARWKLNWLLSGISRDEVMQAARWGPGASTSLPRKRSSPQNKWENAAHVTEGALPWLIAFGRWSGRQRRTLIVDANSVVTVPKNAKTDRTIAIEPDWNCFFQLGLGDAIRRRLQRVGLLHPTAQQRNQRLAKLGSITGLFSTIDLKAASDTISLALCELLLPQNILNYLLELRSPKGRLKDGRVVEYAKVSSMGNGCTFELETAMFWALASSCDPSDDASVYGDDVIVTSEAVPLLLSVFQDLRLEVNTKKTHTAGPFRESCGGHFFRGVDVTPLYFKEEVVDCPSYIRAANKLQAAFNRRDETSVRLRRKIPKSFWGPKGRGDTVLHSEWDETTPIWDADYQSFRLKEVTETRKLKTAGQQGALLHALWGASFVRLFPSKERVIRVQQYTADSW